MKAYYNFPKAQCSVIKCLVFSDQDAKAFRYSVDRQATNLPQDKEKKDLTSENIERGNP